MKITKLSRKKELELLLPSSEIDNMNSFCGILPYFFLSDKAIYDVYKNYNKSTRDEENNWFDEFFKTNNQRRVWFDVQFDGDTDRAYKLYLDTLYSRGCDRYYSKSRYDLLWRSVSSHKNFTDNSMVLKKQKVKLFKTLIKKGALYSEDIDEINTMKKNPRLFLCISRNPIDYLFCSTNQPFTSCQSLYQDTYGKGLPSLTLDPNRFIIFLSEGRIVRSNIRRYTFKHFRYSLRSWALIGNDDTIVIIRQYPDKSIKMTELLETIGYKTKYPNSYGDRKVFISKFEFAIPKLKDDTNSFLYIDNIGLKYLPSVDKVIYDSRDGIVGSMGGSYLMHNIEEIDSDYMEDHFEMGYAGFRCGYCDLFTTYESIETIGEQMVCNKCIKKNFITCKICNYSYNIHNIHNTEDGEMCGHCYTREGFILCDICDISYHPYKIQHKEDMCLCNNCLDHYYSSMEYYSLHKRLLETKLENLL
uniref:Uncharacterized protein n=1 Tax=viral metagenome TaxID=1070528 RepID=A0A6M3XSP8_9ZZZZ